VFLIYRPCEKERMVLCIVVGSSSKSGKHEGLRLFCIPKVISNRREEQEELTTKRRNEWIPAVSRWDVSNKRLENTSE